MRGSKFPKVPLDRKCKLTRKKGWERVPGSMFEKVADDGGIPFCGELTTGIPDKDRKSFASALAKPALAAETAGIGGHFFLLMEPHKGQS